MGIILVVCLAAGLAAVWSYRFFRLDPTRRRKNDYSEGSKKVVYAFFHPYASGGGGGERVLWKMIQFLQSRKPPSSHRRLRCGGGGIEGSTGKCQSNETNEKVTEDRNEREEEKDDNVEILIYTIDPPSTSEHDLRLDAERRFDVSIPKKVRLVSLEEYKDYLSPRPFLSLVMESWGTMKLARKALMATILNENERELVDNKDCEFVFCDTTGCAFTFAMVRWMCPPTIRILAYVHYPTISTDMMLWEWQKTDNNASIKRRMKTVLKLGYYYLFSIAYGLCGSLADLVMVNSTWTYNHIHNLWRYRSSAQRKQQPIEIVYPPCRVPSSADKEVSSDHNVHPRANTIISIGQFRPEKNHKLQIHALSILLKNHPELRIEQSDRINIDTHLSPTSTESSSNSPVKLLLIGSCRNDSDRARVDELRKLTEELDLKDNVVFNINPPYRELQAALFGASIGIHTMRQEHFGIGIVEMMASGLLTIAHDSGGPKSDIVLEVGRGGTGFLATTAEEYAEAMHKALTLDAKEAEAMRQNAKESATRFSDEAFDKSLERVLPHLYCY